MRALAWDPKKSQWLKEVRGVSFDEIIHDKLMDIIQHPTRSNQQILIYLRDGYCWAVPCIIRDGSFLLKTAYPSRKMTRKYLKREM